MSKKTFKGHPRIKKIIAGMIGIMSLFYVVSCGSEESPPVIYTVLAGPPVELVLESTEDTISASWEHGTGAEYYYAFISNDGGVNAITNIIDRSKVPLKGYTIFTNLTPATLYTVTVQSFTVADNSTNLGGEVSATLRTKEPESTPQWTPESVVNLAVTAGDDQATATVTWDDPNIGVPHTGYELEYLTEVKTPITNVNTIGNNADTELSKLSWEGATIVEVLTNDTGSYSYKVGGLDLTAKNVNVFRVSAVHIDDSKQKWMSAYRYYALGIKPPPPEKLRKSTICDKITSVDLAWNPTSGATSYKLYRDKQEIAGNIATNFYTDTGLTAGKEYTYTVQSCSTFGCSGDSDPLTVTIHSDKSFKSIIESGKIPADLADYDQKSQDIFSRYDGGASLMVKYLKPGGTNDGSSFDKAAGNLRRVLNKITDAKATKVYAVLLTGGTYQAGDEIAMKNHVAIIGGVNECLSSEGVTALDGEASYRVFHNEKLDDTALLYGVTVTNGKRYVIVEKKEDPHYTGPPPLNLPKLSTNIGAGMYNNSNSSPSLVRVIFSGNNAELGAGMYNSYSSPSLVRVTFSENTAMSGAGMYNSYSSPSLVGVTFSENTASWQGGGMLNSHSSPRLEGVAFSENKAENLGGGMYNSGSSSPSLERVTFYKNEADTGGAMYNLLETSVSVIGGTFSENRAGGSAGGIYETGFSLRLIGVTFYKNEAKKNGGALFIDHRNSSKRYNNIKDGPGTFIVNSIFWENTDEDGGQLFIGNWGDINNKTSHDPLEPLNIYNSIVQGGTGTSIRSGGYISFWQHHITDSPEKWGGFNSVGNGSPMVLFFSNIIDKDPGLDELADNDGPVLTHAIENTSPAVNEGLYVRKSGDTFYYSENGDDWYNQGVYIKRHWNSSGERKELYSTDYIDWQEEKPDLRTLVTLPDDTEDLTATDATGYTRRDRPDLGAYEAR